jgi:DNA polymerase (family 10)
VVTDEEFPFALAYFTGSKEHNIVMRQRAIARGLRLNEYGLFKSKEETRDPKLRVACATEDEIYSVLDLAYVQPEMREDHGEFDAAEKGKLPKLIEWTDLKGALHNHTTWSDGHNTLEETAAHMEELGLQYWAVTDHSRAAFQAKGLDRNACANRSRPSSVEQEARRRRQRFPPAHRQRSGCIEGQTGF